MDEIFIEDTTIIKHENSDNYNDGNNFLSNPSNYASSSANLTLATSATQHQQSLPQQQTATDLCLVCGDRASGRHYGAISCEGCKGFFKRSIRKQLGYQCRGQMNCEVTKHHRNRCQFCRLQKCLASGMRSDSVQHERKPIIDKKVFQQHSQNSTNNSTSTSSANNSNNQNNIFSNYNSNNNNNLLNFSTTSTSKYLNNNTKLITNDDKFSSNNPVGNLSLFPVGYNFSDLQQSLSKKVLLAASAPYQQLENTSFSNITGQNFSPDNQNNQDDDSDSCKSFEGDQNMKSTTNIDCDLETPTTIAASPSAIQMPSSIENSMTKNLLRNQLDNSILDNSQDLLISLKRQYAENLTNNNGSNNQNNNNNNNINNNNNNVTIKSEIIEDRHNLSSPSSPLENSLNVFDSPILLDTNIPFPLQSPQKVPNYLNTHYVCETGSRILFLSVYWLKKIPAFQILSDDIQIKLIRYHWVKLFSIGLAQSSKSISMPIIIQTLSENILRIIEQKRKQNDSNDEEKSIQNEIDRIEQFTRHTLILNNFVEIIQSLNLTDDEYGYIRLICAFSSEFLLFSLTKNDQIEKDKLVKLQEYSLNCFKIYLIENNSSDGRLEKILLNLMQLNSLKSNIIEELFFSNLIGNIQIDNMIPYILKLGGGGI